MQTFIRATMVALLVISGFGLQAQAQTTATDVRAVVAFEVDFERMRATSVGQMMGDQVNAGIEQELSGLDMESIVSVKGSLSLPESLADFEAVETTGVLPIEFYARVKFSNAEALDSAFEQIESDSEEVEQNGITYLRPPAEANAPDNLRARRIDDTTMEVGTAGYIQMESSDTYSDNLASAWNKMPDHAFRVAIDIDGARSLIEEAIEMGKDGAPPMFGGFMDLPKLASSIRMTFDFSGDQLMTFGATGVDAEKAEELDKNLGAVLAMGKMFGQEAVKEVEEADPDTASVLSAILDALTTKVDGNDIQVEIPKPDGFEEALGNMMMMGG